MVNLTKVEGLLRNLREYLSQLHNAATLSFQDLTSDPLKLSGVKYYLQVAIEACVDIANHIIASEHLRAPKTYTDTFVVLNEQGILPEDFTQTCVQMAKTRNRLIHLYREVDGQELYKIITTELGVFDTFVRYILHYLNIPNPPAQSRP